MDSPRQSSGDPQGDAAALMSEAPGGTVLILDDEQMVTTSLRTMLALETRHTVVCFNNPRQALDELMNVRPDVVISDFLMPEMDGIAFLQQVKAKLPDCTLILLTGYADKENAIQAINTVGIYRYIEKPWDNEALKLSIRTGLERARLTVRLHETINALQQAKGQLEQYNQELETLVTARTRDLEIAYQKLQSIFQNTTDGILTLTPDLSLSAWNLAAERWLLKVFPNPKAFTAAAVERFLSLPERHHTIRSFFQPDQSRLLKEAAIGPVPVEVSISPIPGEQGYVLVLRDIAQRKEVERLREDFVSTLTHDLRTPLLAAIRTLEFYRDGSLGPLETRQVELMDSMILNNQEMLGLVNVLLEVYKYESGRQRLLLDRVEIGELLASIGQELQALALSRQQTLTIEPSAQPLPVPGDKHELRRVFMNLIGNALNYTPAGGSIQVTATRGADRIEVAVQDNGRGIPAKDLPQLFQRFSQGTSRQRSSGTGLGLYLSRQITEAHKGTIRVESQEGQGSRFTVTLPLLDGVVDSTALSAESQPVKG